MERQPLTPNQVSWIACRTMFLVVLLLLTVWVSGRLWFEATSQERRERQEKFNQEGEARRQRWQAEWAERDRKRGH